MTDTLDKLTRPPAGCNCMWTIHTDPETGWPVGTIGHLGGIDHNGRRYACPAAPHRWTWTRPKL